MKILYKGIKKWNDKRNFKNLIRILNIYYDKILLYFLIHGFLISQIKNSKNLIKTDSITKNVNN